jgi:hypothetical protein
MFELFNYFAIGILILLLILLATIIVAIIYLHITDDGSMYSARFGDTDLELMCMDIDIKHAKHKEQIELDKIKALQEINESLKNLNKGK